MYFPASSEDEGYDEGDDDDEVKENDDEAKEI